MKKNNCAIIIQDEAILQLKSYRWYGNVRQLMHYLGSLLNNARYDKKYLITRDDILKHEPRNYKIESLAGNLSGFEELESVLLKLLKDWGDKPRYNFIDEFISPIVAKLYLEDLKDKYKKVDSSAVIGLAGTGGKNSTLDKRFEMYKEIREYFLKETKKPE